MFMNPMKKTLITEKNSSTSWSKVISSCVASVGAILLIFPLCANSVCLDMKISEHVFEAFLNSIYKLNLAGQLKVQISLEVDKLPEETQAMYLKQEPVMVDGKYRNIIAIDVTKGDKEQ